jgi:hypothetical protein
MAHKKDWKGCPPRVQSICIVDDEEVCRRQYRELIEAEFPKLAVRAYDTIFAAYGAGHFDYLIIDVSSVAPLMMSDVAHAWAPIAKFMENHPGTEIIIVSAMSRSSTHEVIEEVARACGNPDMVHYGGIGVWESSVELGLKTVLHNLIKPLDMEWTKIKSKRNK